MTTQPSDRAIQALLRRATRSANARARDGDDRTFHDELRAQVGTQDFPRGGGVRRTLRTRRREPRGPKLADDPRYLANLRALARRGEANTRIVGGSRVRGTAFHDCVAVGTDDDWGCTGTLIRPNVVLTAAHCDEYHTRVFIGNDIDGAGRIYAVARAVRHPRFRKTFYGDLMLLVLEKSVVRVKPRKLASKKQVDAATDARLIGFGNTDIASTRGYGVKRQTDVPIVSNACRGKVGRRSDGSVYGCHRGSEIVAGKPFLLRDTCEGDSGGPLYISNRRGGWLLAGVTSRGTDLAQTMCGDGGLYVRVDTHRKWIDSVISKSARR